MKRLVLAISAIVLLAGCARTPPLPTYPEMPADQTLTILAEQEREIRSAIGEGSVTLTRADGQSVRLDSAMVAQFPDHVRLRAWKLGHAVFDLTLTPEGVWMLVPDKSRREKILPAGANAASFMRGWSALHGGFYSDPALKTVSVTPEALVVERPADNGTTIRATIDRATLVVLRHEVIDDQGVSRFALSYDKYRLIDGFAWPMRLRAQGEQGEIDVQFDEVQLNAPPAEGAFVPPRRAEKLQ